jgi:peptidoglycan lytic transglycosylase
MTPKVSPSPIVKADAGVAEPLPPGTAALDEAMVVSYWTTADERAGADRFAAEDFAAARTAFAKARAAAPATSPAVPRLELMLGLCDAELGNHADAAQHLQVAAKAMPELADYIGYHLAHSLWLAHDPGAQAIAEKVAHDSIVGPDAEILVGELLRERAAAKGDAHDPAVAAFYKDYLARRPHGPFRSEARFDLAEVSPPAEAMALYRLITIEDPLSSWATKATALLKPMKHVPPLTAAEHLAQGMVLFDNMRNPESEAAFDAALADKKISKPNRCLAAYHRAQSRYKARDRKNAAPMFEDAITACKAAGNTDLEIKSHYQAARSYSFIGQHEPAIAHYKQIETIDPKHSYADDASLREGEEWSALGDDKQVEAVLSAMPAKYPTGDTIAEAMWRLGFRAWREQRYDDAIKWWKEQIRLVPHDDNWFGEGQAQYWLGRAYMAKKQLPEAIASWQQTVREYPAAYYGMLALNRLREAAPKEFQALVAEIARDPAGFDPKAPAFHFKPRADWASPGFQRAMELLRLGLGEPAEQELKKVGLTPPGNRKRVDDPDQLEKLWAIAFLYDHAGRYSTSIWPTRWHALDYRRAWPVGANRAKWQIAYPRAFEEILARHAKLNGVPFAMQIAIVREESGFDPIEESYANAIGLTQMIPPTAHDFAKGTGIDPTRENLRDPEKNVTIGSRFLGSLYKTWNNFTLLVPTSYNAGPGAVRRMLRARGTWDADEFVEAIVDDQARNYTKRVLGSYFTYSWLYEHTVPEIPNTIPAALLPKSK